MAKKEDSLGPYRGKRDFERTPEPAGGRKRRGRTQPRFVVHKHDATTLHYDFRLEAAGVLKSWAVPKGPSTNPKDKRLAMPTQDHPLAYFDYEGLIPVDRAVTDGHVAVWLEGRKLRGGYALTRIGRGKRERWRWSRWPTRRPTPGASQSRANRSRWSRVEPSRRSPRRARPARIGGDRIRWRPRAVVASPMQATLSDRWFSDPGWVVHHAAGASSSCLRRSGVQCACGARTSEREGNGALVHDTSGGWSGDEVSIRCTGAANRL